MVLFRRTALVLLLAVMSMAQSSPPTSAQTAAQASPEPEVTLHANTRMVTVEVVARDHHGNPAEGLTADDFQVFEETTASNQKKEKSEQKIAVFRAVGISQLIAQDHGSVHLPQGIYSNVVSLREHPVPPTILLVDGINTELSSQMQIHRQMIRMLNSFPKDVPAAIFLLGRQLKLIQGFTTDPALLRAALDKAGLRQHDMVQQDPQDVPDSLSALQEFVVANDPNMSSDMGTQASLANILQFEQETYASNIDTRMRITVNALLSLARNVSGYPGRKNLLWLSSSFPILLDPTSDREHRDYSPEMKEVAAALSQAKLAVYPIDMAGVQTESFFDASTRTRSRVADTGATATNVMGAIDREASLNVGRELTMENLATDTGGKVCTGDNDLGDCIKKAVNDSSSFYEISYYPTSSDWNGEFRKIIVKAKRNGLHLSYREGYYARGDNAGGAKTAESDLRQAGCSDYLPSTSILLMAEAVPPDSPDDLKYMVAVDAGDLTFAPEPDGTRTVDVDVAVCTFSKSAEPLKLIVQPIHAKLAPKEYQAVLAMHGLRRLITIPAPRPAEIRLVVRDNPTGQLGSINIPVAEKAAALSPQTQKAATAQ